MTEQTRRQKNERVGRYAEFFTIIYMLLKGYRLLEQRYKCSAGEIDLIFKRRKIIIFCEVKYRKDKSQLAYSLGEKQKLRILKTAECWLAHKNLTEYNARFDFIGLTLWQKPIHIKDAF
ncbi:MAG: YraN family protein [Rhizobiales bacterium]|nr:YraN family protein [Hyphomicrobiales bacterium]